jgi:hypothetical protein
MMASPRTILGIRMLAMMILAVGAGSRVVDSGLPLPWRLAHGIALIAALAVMAHALWHAPTIVTRDADTRDHGKDHRQDRGTGRDR